MVVVAFDGDLAVIDRTAFAARTHLNGQFGDRQRSSVHALAMQNGRDGLAADDKGISHIPRAAVTDLSRIASYGVAEVVVQLAYIYSERKTGDPKIPVFLVFIQHAEIANHRLSGKAAFI